MSQALESEALEPRMRIVAVSGSLHRPSSTTALVAGLAAAVAERVAADVRVLELADLGPLLGGALRREALAPEVEEALVAIETADLLVVTGARRVVLSTPPSGRVIDLDRPRGAPVTGGASRAAPDLGGTAGSSDVL